jgi:cysteine-rich repeat protein
MQLRALFLVSVLSAGCSEGLCGDDTLDQSEACDDGNTTDADGCEADCSLPACNNSIVDPVEVCLLAPVAIEVDFAPQELVTADFNGDGKPDLATATSNFSISVLLNQGNGQFLRAADIELSGIGLSLVTGDFDGNGTSDLAAALRQDDRIEAFLGTGDGSFVLFSTLVTSLGPESLITGDFNNDGQFDLATGNAQGASVDLFLGLNGGFAVARTTQTTSGVADLAAGDVNGDNDLDLIITHGIDEDALRVLLGDGAGNFTVQAPQPAGDTPGSILTNDFNNDGKLDIAIGRPLAGEIGIFSGDGSGLFLETQIVPAFGAIALAVGDFDGDGVLDIAAASDFDLISSHLDVLLGNDVGRFSILPPLQVSTGNLSGIAIADFNEDGALDVALSDQSNASIFVLLSQP